MSERKVARVAVVGCGSWTQGWHLPNLSNRDDAKIVALVDPSDQEWVSINRAKQFRTDHRYEIGRIAQLNDFMQKVYQWFQKRGRILNIVLMSLRKV